MTQGAPLAMVSYIIVAISIIKIMKAAYPDIPQPWYVDDAGALGTFDNIGLYFNPLKQFDLGREYYPKPLEIIIIVHPDNITPRKYCGLRPGFKFCPGVCYMVGFIGDEESKRDFLGDQTPKWE